MTSLMREPLKDRTFCLECGNVMEIRRPWWAESPVGECQACETRLTSALRGWVFALAMVAMQVGVVVVLLLSARSR